MKLRPAKYDLQGQTAALMKRYRGGVDGTGTRYWYELTTDQIAQAAGLKRSWVQAYARDPYGQDGGVSKVQSLHDALLSHHVKVQRSKSA